MLRARRRPRAATAPFLLALTLAGGCHIEDRTPTGTRRDEDAVRATLAAYYRAGAAHEWSTVRGVFWDSANVAVRPLSGAAWVDFATAEPYLGYLRRTWGALPAGEPATRVIRSDYRQDEGLATVWAVVRQNAPGATGRLREVGRVDHFVFRQIGGGWRIVHLVSVPDPSDDRP